MKEKGVSGKDDWNKQTQTFEELEARVLLFNHKYSR
jgi:hypothetical protein